jgi:hypothetical protein
MASLTRDSVDGMNLVSGMTRTPLLESLSTLLLERDRPGRRSESSLNSMVAIDVQLDCWIYAYSIAIEAYSRILTFYEAATIACESVLRVATAISLVEPAATLAGIRAQGRPGYQERPEPDDGF